MRREFLKKIFYRVFKHVFLVVLPQFCCVKFFIFDMVVRAVVG